MHSNLASEADSPVQKGAGESYTISIQRLVDAVRQKHMEAIVRDRFSIIGDLPT
jgi:hypothetical protein